MASVELPLVLTTEAELAELAELVAWAENTPRIVAARAVVINLLFIMLLVFDCVFACFIVFAQNTAII
jgi:hypothetical protein